MTSISEAVPKCGSGFAKKRMNQQRSSPGRTRSVSQAEREGLMNLIHRPPEEFGIYSPCWKPADLEAVAKGTVKQPLPNRRGHVAG